MKKASSAWVHNEIGVESFAWQQGYSAFTVSATSRDGVKRYVASQSEHHRQRSFQDEPLDLLKRAEIEFDERYLD